MINIIMVLISYYTYFESLRLCSQGTGMDMSYAIIHDIIESEITWRADEAFSICDSP